MSKPFKGAVNVDIKESVPDWEQHTQVHKVVIDVSGEPFVDLAQEAMMAFARD